ncbi:hypothetical protein AZH53_01440 [Methanomicrobiaceae archaeon CYW5]|uniref:nickel pincer cofactor biosynthesis protein LarC n=1 Tax=Methanovulcanius yangii TaxID=1789227 RepID=UPI0029CA9DCE|nr:nickel pincer cofactor biosynthesis protein LarC [Methanovulcanius yangii]MBT8507093.1 hypothetical protein [Methanovulcanius yangii]
MKTLLLDPFSGAAGDMIIGALLGCGADTTAVTTAMASVVGPPAITMTDRCGIRAVQVKTGAGKKRATIEEVLERLGEANAPDEVIAMAERIFLRIHAGESVIHGEHVHFHEVGADDAIADVVGACTAFCSLAVDHVIIRPVHLGTGTLRGSHGNYPIPSPATIEILREGRIPARFTDADRELCTPTGAAILAEFASRGKGDSGEGTILGIGYGAGTRNPADSPNVLRAVLYGNESREVGTIDILETNVDDATGEVIAYTLERLMREGARDATASPLIMKKGRPGTMIRVICGHGDSDRFCAILSEELGTLGIRCIQGVHRSVIERSFIATEVAIGDQRCLIPVKIGWKNGIALSVKAEYEDTRRFSEMTGTRYQAVARIAEDKVWEQVMGGKCD